MNYVLVASVVVALLGSGYGYVESLRRGKAQAEAEAAKKDAGAARDERDRAYRTVEQVESEREKERARAQALDGLLVAREERQKVLENDKASLKGAYDEIRKKLDRQDVDCLARELPDSIRLRLKP